MDYLTPKLDRAADAPGVAAPTLSPELDALLVLARREAPSAREKAVVFERIQRTIDRKRDRSAAYRGGHREARSASASLVLLVGLALVLPFVAVKLRTLSEREPRGDVAEGVHAAGVASSVAERAGNAVPTSAAAPEQSCPRLTPRSPTSMEHRSAHQRTAARTGATRRGSATPSRSIISAELAANEGKDARTQPPPEAAKFSSAERERDPQELTREHAGQRWDTATLIGDSAPNSERARAEERLRKLVAEANARYSAALGERARIASTQRPLPSVAWY